VGGAISAGVQSLRGQRKIQNVEPKPKKSTVGRMSHRLNSERRISDSTSVQKAP